MAAIVEMSSFRRETGILIAIGIEGSFKLF